MFNTNEVKNSQSGLINPKRKKLFIVKGENLFIFFSVDICNSTKLKHNNKNWFEANNILYTENFSSMRLWKSNGDEVLYAEPFVNLAHLALLINNAYCYIKQLQKEIGTAIKDPLFQLKGTIWLARTYFKSDKSEDNSNHNTGADYISRANYDSNLQIKDFDSMHEFLGINIDEGFRLAKRITGSKIAIDPRICYLFLLANDIYSNTNKCNFVDYENKFHYYARNIHPSEKKEINKILENIYFINYTKLKGVWHDRGYPVFWYYQKQSDLFFDDQMDDLFVRPVQVLEMDWLSKIENIFNIAGVKDEFLNIIRMVVYEKPKAIYNLEAKARLYYAVACINPTTKNILVVQRSGSRNHLKKVWEFAPFKHTSKAITESIEQRFLDEFGIEISMLTDGEEERNILPIHFCTIYRNGQPHNSILCVAKFIGQKSDEEIINTIKEHANKERYIDFRLINSNDVNDFNPIDLKEIERDSLAALSDSATDFEDNKCVMYFGNSVKAVSNLYSKLEKGENWYT